MKETDSKTRLLETACDLIARSSYGSTSVDNICKASGLNKGSFYYFFKSKAELTAASLEYNWNALYPLYQRNFDPRHPPLVRLEKHLTTATEIQIKKKKAYGHVIGCVFTALGCELSSQEEQVRRKVEEINARKCAFIATAIQDGQWDGSIANTTPAKQLAIEFHSMMLGLMLSARASNNMTPIMYLKDGCLKLLGINKYDPQLISI